jgi:hypothetical protein
LIAWSPLVRKSPRSNREGHTVFWDSFIIAGALAGAFHGVDAIPEEWIQPVVDANPEVDMHAVPVEFAPLHLRESEQMSGPRLRPRRLTGAELVILGDR